MTSADSPSAPRADGTLRIIDADQTRARLPFANLIAALREAFVAGCEVPARHHHTIERRGLPSATLLLMPAWTATGFLGVKVVSVFPGNAARHEPALHSTYLLSDGTTGRPLAMIDGNELTGRRTVAASALAASFLAREDASSLLIVGAGRVASLVAAAYREVRPIERVTVWNTNLLRAEKLAARLRGDGFDAVAATRLDQAAAQADIITCATLSTQPLIEGRWLRPGTHLDLIGGFTPTMRETDDEAVRRSAVYVDTMAAVEEAGDLVMPIAAGHFAASAVRGTLEMLCRGATNGRASRDQITMFKSVGTALEDLAAAALVYSGRNDAGYIAGASR